MKTKTHITAVLFVASLLVLPCHAQEKDAGKDPYKKDSGTESTPKKVKQVRINQDPFAVNSGPTRDYDQKLDGPVNILISYEAFSLPLAKAAAIQRENLPDAELYSRLVAAAEGEGVKQESLVVITAQSGHKATSEGISERIYPTEFESATMPETVGVAILPEAGKDAPAAVPDTAKLKDAVPAEALGSLVAPTNPTAFDTRNVGVTLEVEPTRNEDGDFIDLRIIPEHITDVGSAAWGQGVSTAEMPVFEEQSLNTGATLRVGAPVLLGTMNRPPVSKVDPDSANRVWFAFVTATLKYP
jgi:hypothetical protein